jgi:uncharacterized membrane protein
MSVVQPKAERDPIPLDWKKVIDLFYGFLGALLILSIVAPAMSKYQSGPSNFAYQFLHLFCHQQPSRCWTVGGSPLGLCVRCFWLLVGLIGGRAVSIYTQSKWAIVFLLMPMIVDGGTQFIGWRVSTTTLRVITGGLAGIGLHLYMQQFYREYFRGGFAHTWQTERVTQG